jgi:hypothetical protein
VSDVLLHIFHTKHRDVRWQEHILAMKQVSGVNYVLEEEPKKEFMLILHFRSPHPFEQRGCLMRTLKKAINLFARESSSIPNISPDII